MELVLWLCLQGTLSIFDHPGFNFSFLAPRVSTRTLQCWYEAPKKSAVLGIASMDRTSEENTQWLKPWRSFSLVTWVGIFNLNLKNWQLKAASLIDSVLRMVSLSFPSKGSDWFLFLNPHHCVYPVMNYKELCWLVPIHSNLSVFGRDYNYRHLKLD